MVHAAKGSTQIDYTYDMEGIRSSKTVGGVTHNYVTQNGKVVRERWDGSYTIWIIYDAGGKPFSMLYSYDGGVNWSTYYYILNLQGDVVKLVDASGNTAASYTYDAWGKPLTATGTMASINPLRYRGYYYDTETGWYYLQSRYYDPVVKRFINADVFASTGQGFLGYNMFAYCNNNPTNMSDTGGGRPSWEHSYGDGIVGYTDSRTSSNAPKTTSSYFGIIGSISHDATRRPYTGEPNSSYETPKGDRRYYDEDGKPYLDYDNDDHGNDKNHPNGGHWHVWKNGERDSTPLSEPPRDPLVGIGMMLGGCAALIVLCGDDLTGIGACDDVYIDQVILWIEQGWTLVFE